MAEVDIIIPVFRPKSGWTKFLVENLRSGLSKEHQFHLYIINDGGQNFSEIERKLLLESTVNSPIRTCHIHEYAKNEGKGHAIRCGLNLSISPVIIYTDDDLPYGVKAINQMADILNQKGGAVIPSRSKDYFDSLPIKRKYISKGLIWMNKYLLRMKHPDTQAGLKGLDDSMKNLVLASTMNGFLFEIEWIKNAEKRSINIQAMEVQLITESIPSGVSTGNLIKLISDYIRLIIQH